MTQPQWVWHRGLCSLLYQVASGKPTDTLGTCAEEPGVCNQAIGCAVAVSTSSKFWDLGQVPLVCLCLSFPSCKMGTITIVAPSDSWEWAHTHEARERQPSAHTRVQHMCLSDVASSPSHWIFSHRANQPRMFPWAVCVPPQVCQDTGVASGTLSRILWQWMWSSSFLSEILTLYFDTLYISPVAPVRSFMDENTLFFNFLLYTGVQLINNTVLVSHVQQTDSVITIHVFSYMCIFQICFPFRLLHNIEQGSLCCTVGLFWLFSVYMSVPNSLTMLPPILPCWQSYSILYLHTQLKTSPMLSALFSQPPWSGTFFHHFCWPAAPTCGIRTDSRSLLSRSLQNLAAVSDGIFPLCHENHIAHIKISVITMDPGTKRTLIKSQTYPQPICSVSKK